MDISATEQTPAHKLIGLELLDEWSVIEYFKPKPGATGGFYSVGYIVRNKQGRDAFLKAIDLSRADNHPDPAKETESMLKTFNFEKNLVERCRKKNLSQVVTGLDSGTIRIDGTLVPFLIFEIAQNDMRSALNFGEQFDLAWTLRLLHSVAKGLEQLHGVDIAHQDLKPSNILVFRGLITKLADLGNAAHPEWDVKHNEFVIPGARSYAPPELRYNERHSDFKTHRFGNDTFLLGNIVLYAFTGQTVSSILFTKLAPEHSPGMWNGTFAEVLPYIQKAFVETIELVAEKIPLEVRDEIILMVQQLCEPDPMRRGDRKSGNNYSLQRFITRLSVLMYKADNRLFRI